MAAMVFVAGNATMPHLPFVQSGLDESSLRVEAEEPTRSKTSRRKHRDARPSAAGNGSRSLPNSSDGRETLVQEVAVDNANDRFDVRSPGCGNRSFDPTISDNTGAANPPERTSEFADNSCRSSSRAGAVEDDPYDPSADPLATTKPLLASPPPLLRHHLLFPPLGDDVVAETDHCVGRLRASFDHQFYDVGRRTAFEEKTPDVNTHGVSGDTESTDAPHHFQLQQQQQSRLSCRTVVMPNRDPDVVVKHTPSARMGLSIAGDNDESRDDVLREEKSVEGLHRPDGISRRLAKSLPESSSSYAPGDADRRTAIDDDAVPSRIMIDGDGTVTTSGRRISNDGDTSFGSTSRLWPTTEDVGWTNGDDAETPDFANRRWPRGRQMISASGSFVDAGSRNESARRLIYETDGASTSCSVIASRPPPCVRSSGRHSRRSGRFDAASSVPSSSSYLSDGASSTTSRTSSMTSSISSSLDLVRRRWDDTALSSLATHHHASSGTRRRRGRRPISTTTTTTTMQVTDRDGFRRPPRVAHRDSSTDCQVWDEYQVGLSSGSDVDDYEEERFDAEALLQTEWPVERIRRRDDQDGGDYRSRRRLPTTKADAGGAIWRTTQKQSASCDQVRQRVNAVGAPVVNNTLPAVAVVGENDVTSENFDPFDRTTTRFGCHGSVSVGDDDNENNVAESYVTTDSDAEDLAQLVDDSRRAFHLTTIALDEAKRLVAAAAIADPADRRGSGGSSSSSTAVVDNNNSAVSRRCRPKLKEEMATCRTNIDCLEQLIDALHHGMRNGDGRTVTDVNRLTDLLIQWRNLDSQLSHLITAECSPPKPVQRNQQQQSRETPVPLDSASVSGQQLHSRLVKEQRDGLFDAGFELTASGNEVNVDSVGRCFVDDVQERSRYDDRRLHGTPAAATLVDETKSSPDISYHRSAQDTADDNFDHVIDLSMYGGLHGDLESLQPTRKRRISNRVCDCLAMPNNGTRLKLLKLLFTALLLLAIVVYAVNECNSATNDFNCHAYKGLSLSPRLRYVMGPPPT